MDDYTRACPAEIHYFVLPEVMDDAMKAYLGVVLALLVFWAVALYWSNR